MDPIQNIIVPVDFSELSRAAVRQAGVIARIDGASIHLVHALRFPLIAAPYEVSVPAAVWQGFHQGAREQMEALKKEAEASGVASVTSEIGEALDPVELVSEAVERHDADLIVMGTHGYSGIKHSCLGSVTERTIRKLACPVLAVKDEAGSSSQAIEQILVPVDFSVHSDQAATRAANLATRLGASVDLVHAIDFATEYAAYLAPDAMEIELKMQDVAAQRLEDVVGSIAASGLKVQTHLLRGKPSVVIEAMAKRLGSDLIVMGTHGHTGLSHLFIGSVTERMLRISPCSLLAVKAAEDSSGA